MIQNVIQVAFLEQYTLHRKALVHLLSNFDDMRVAIDSGSINDFFLKLSSYPDIDVLIVTISYPDHQVKSILQGVQTQYGKIRIILVSNMIDPQFVGGFLEYGIHGCISRDADPAELSEAIRMAGRGMLYKNNILTEALYWSADTRGRFTKKKRKVDLTDMQKRLLALLYQEKSMREIAEEISLSVSAVEKIKQNLKDELDVKTTIGLIKYYIENNAVQEICGFPHP